MPRPRFTAAALASAALFVLAIAPQAMAGRITYNVDPGSQYAVKDNGNGIVKLTYNGCVTAVALQTLRFVMTTTVTRDAPRLSRFSMAEGQDPRSCSRPTGKRQVRSSD